MRARENAFASCPAATGEMGCTDFPDGAHRCAEDREHVRTNVATDHRCTCSAVWADVVRPVPSNAAVPAVVFIQDQPQDAEFARGVKAAIQESRRRGGPPWR